MVTERRPTDGITVVIAARNAAPTIAAALRSALRCESLVQCVVVDDASDDGTASAAREAAGSDPRVQILQRATRGGPSVARDDGLVAAVAARVCFLDADDALVDGALDRLAAAMDATTGAVAAIGRFAAIDNAGNPADVGEWSRAQLAPVVSRHGRLVESGDGLSAEALVTRLVSPPPGAWLVDARCALAVGGFDPRARRSEDLEFLVRLAEAGRLVSVDEVVLHYARHDRQRSAASTRRRFGRGHTMWLILRGAPSAKAAHRLAGGIRAYHLELFERRRDSQSTRVRVMALRNLAAALVVPVAGLVAGLLPRRSPAPLGRHVAPVE